MRDIKEFLTNVSAAALRVAKNAEYNEFLKFGGASVRDITQSDFNKENLEVTKAFLNSVVESLGGGTSVKKSLAGVDLYKLESYNRRVNFSPEILWGDEYGDPKEASYNPAYFIIDQFVRDQKLAVETVLKLEATEEKFAKLNAIVEKNPGTLRYVLDQGVKDEQLLEYLIKNKGVDIVDAMQNGVKNENDLGSLLIDKFIDLKKAEVDHELEQGTTEKKLAALNAIIAKTPGTLNYILEKALNDHEVLNGLLKAHADNITAEMKNVLLDRFVNSYTRDYRSLNVLLDNGAKVTVLSKPVFERLMYVVGTSVAASKPEYTGFVMDGELRMLNGHQNKESFIQEISGIMSKVYVNPDYMSQFVGEDLYALESYNKRSNYQAAQAAHKSFDPNGRKDYDGYEIDTIEIPAQEASYNPAYLIIGSWIDKQKIAINDALKLGTTEEKLGALNEIIQKNPGTLNYILDNALKDHEVLKGLMERHGKNIADAKKNDLLKQCVKSKEKNMQSFDLLLDNGAQIKYDYYYHIAPFVEDPEVLTAILSRGDQAHIFFNNTGSLSVSDMKGKLLTAAVDQNNKESVSLLINAGVKIEYDHLKDAVAKAKEDLGIVNLLLQNGAPTQFTDRYYSTSILSSIENHPKKDEITAVVAQHEALRKGFEDVKTELLKLQDFKDMDPEQLMGIIHKVMFEEGGPVREYFNKVSLGSVARSVDSDGVTNEEFSPNTDRVESFAKEFVNEISLTYWEEFKIWFISIFSEETQAQLRADLITPQLDELFKKEIFGAVRDEIAELSKDESAKKRHAVYEDKGLEDMPSKKAPEIKEPESQSRESKPKSFVQRLLEERGQAPSQDHGRG